MAMDSSSAAKSLKRLRARAGMSVRAIAEAIDRRPSSYQFYEDEFKKEYLPRELVLALAPVLESRGVSRSEVMALAGDESPREPEPPPPMKIAPFGDERLAPREWSRDLKVLGSGSCGSQGDLFEFQGNVIEYLPRPPRLVGVPDAYVLEVDGDSMRHWRKHGERVYVNPRMKVNVGDHVVVQIKPKRPGDSVGAYIKELARRTEKDLVLLQYNPEKEMRLRMADVLAIHRILEQDELLGN